MDSMARIKIRLNFLEKNREKLIETDKYISDFYRTTKEFFLKHFYSMFFDDALDHGSPSQYTIHRR